MKLPLRLLLLFTATALALGAAEPKRPRILGVSHAAFYVSDMAKARAFYEGFLGFQSPYSIPRKDPTEQLVWIKLNDRQRGRAGCRPALPHRDRSRGRGDDAALPPGKRCRGRAASDAIGENRQSEF